MARRWPKGWNGFRQGSQEHGAAVQGSRPDPAAGWPWIPRPAAAGAGAAVGTGELVTSPAVEQLQMAARASTRKRGLGRRPKVLDDEKAAPSSPEAAQPQDVEANQEAPASAEETVATSPEPEPEPTYEGAAAAEADTAASAGDGGDQPSAVAASTDDAAASQAEIEPEDDATGSEADAETAAAGLAALAGAGASTGGWRRWLGASPGADGRRPWLGTKQVAAVVLLLLAAEVGYVVSLNVSSSSNKSASPPALGTLPPVKSPAPGAALPVPPPAPKTAPAASPSTTAAPAKPAVAPVVAAAAPLGPCTAHDLDIATRTGQSSYSVGQAVNVLTTVTDVHSCIFQPAPTGAYSCASSIVIASGGNQVWPAPGQAESCNAPAGMTMNPGSTESLSATWTASAAGTYEALGEWGWSGGSGQPTNTANVPSAPFTVS